MPHYSDEVGIPAGRSVSWHHAHAQAIVHTHPSHAHAHVHPLQHPQHQPHAQHPYPQHPNPQRAPMLSQLAQQSCSEGSDAFTSASMSIGMGIGDGFDTARTGRSDQYPIHQQSHPSSRAHTHVYQQQQQQQQQPAHAQQPPMPTAMPFTSAEEVHRAVVDDETRSSLLRRLVVQESEASTEPEEWPVPRGGSPGRMEDVDTSGDAYANPHSSDRSAALTPGARAAASAAAAALSDRSITDAPVKALEMELTAAETPPPRPVPEMAAVPVDLELRLEPMPNLPMPVTQSHSNVNVVSVPPLPVKQAGADGAHSSQYYGAFLHRSLFYLVSYSICRWATRSTHPLPSGGVTVVRFLLL
jgi:hypothetical protein